MSWTLPWLYGAMPATKDLKQYINLMSSMSLDSNDKVSPCSMI